MQIDFTLSLTELDQLARRADSRGKNLTLSKAMLRKLIVDHTRAVAVLQQLRVEIQEPRS